MKNVEKKGRFHLFRTHIINKKSGIYLAVLVCIELICLGVLLFEDISRPKMKLNCVATDFVYNNLDNADVQNSKLIFSPMEGVSEDQPQNVRSNEFSLPSGAYEFHISYVSNTDGSGDYTKSAGSLAIKSDHYDIETDTIMLDDGHQSTVGRFWVPAFSKCDDLHLVVQYKGQGTLKLGRCTITEYRGYRAIRFLGFLAVFILIDFLCIIFFTDYPVKFNKRVVGIAGIVLMASLPFLDDILYSGHDLWFHMARIVAISQGLSQGQFPVRISTELNNGFGYTNSLYYCDIFLYASAILYKFRLPLRMCYQFYVIVVNIFTGLSTYYAMSRFTKKNGLKLLGTMLYMLCTYRLVNMNIRSAVGEYTAMCFLPLIVVGLYNIMKKEDIRISDWFPLAVGMSGVIMSHVVTAEMLVINIALLCILLISRMLSFGRIKAMLKAVLASVMMTAWFLIPFFDSVMGQGTVAQEADVRLLGEDVNLWTSLTESWTSLFQIFGPGYDAGNSSEAASWTPLGLPFILGIVLLLYCLYHWKNTENWNKKMRSKITGFRVLCLFTFLNILFVSRVFPWTEIQNLLGLGSLGRTIGTIQFAWRFLAIAAILLSVSVIVALDVIGDRKRQFYKISVVTILVAIITGWGFFHYNFYDYQNQRKWSNAVNYTVSDDLYFLEGTDSQACNISACQVQEGQASVKAYKKVDGKATLHIKNYSKSKKAKITVPIFAYDHYHVYKLKGKSLGSELPYSKDENNCILITVPAGFDGDIQVSFVEPMLWRVAEIISLLTWIFIIYRVLQRVISKRKERHCNDFCGSVHRENY